MLQGDLQPIRVRLSAHHERFEEIPQLNPLCLETGERIVLTGVLYPSVLAKPASAPVVGKAQIFVYPAECTIDLFELALFDAASRANQHRHATLHTLWQNLEHHLMTQFPQAQTLITPATSGSHPAHVWQQFLLSLGYSARGATNFHKHISPSS
jgi:hypothetical protein